MKSNFDKQWLDIAENFDWDSVYVVMKALDWTWANGDGTNSIPTPSAMKKTAVRLLGKAWQEWPGGLGEFCVSTGGFVAGFDGQFLSLRFTLTGWHTDPTNITM